jgi:hypothetical protein
VGNQDRCLASPLIGQHNGWPDYFWIADNPVTGKVDVFPAQGRDMLEVIGIERARFRHHLCGAFEVDRIPECDGGDFQIQPARPVPLVFERAIAYFSEPVEEDRSRQRISSLTFIKACSHAPTQGWVFKPCEA